MEDREWMGAKGLRRRFSEGRKRWTGGRIEGRIEEQEWQQEEIKEQSDVREKKGRFRKKKNITHC